MWLLIHSWPKPFLLQVLTPEDKELQERDKIPPQRMMQLLQLGFSFEDMKSVRSSSIEYLNPSHLTHSIFKFFSMIQVNDMYHSYSEMARRENVPNIREQVMFWLCSESKWWIEIALFDMSDKRIPFSFCSRTWNKVHISVLQLLVHIYAWSVETDWYCLQYARDGLLIHSHCSSFGCRGINDFEWPFDIFDLYCSHKGGPLWFFYRISSNSSKIVLIVIRRNRFDY